MGSVEMLGNHFKLHLLNFPKERNPRTGLLRPPQGRITSYPSVISLRIPGTRLLVYLLFLALELPLPSPIGGLSDLTCRVFSSERRTLAGPSDRRAEGLEGGGGGVSSIGRWTSGTTVS